MNSFKKFLIIVPFFLLPLSIGNSTEAAPSGIGASHWKRFKKEVKPNIYPITVKEGDTLWSIARTVFGDPWLWPLIPMQNSIGNPNEIDVGRNLNIRTSGISENEVEAAVKSALEYEDVHEALASGHWEKMPTPLWKELAGMGTAVFNGKLWVLGGYGRGVMGGNDMKSGVFCTADGSHWWEVKSRDLEDVNRRPNHPRWFKHGIHLNMVVFKNKVWMIGGWNEKNSTEIRNSSDGKEWHQVADAPAYGDLNSSAAVVFADKIWLIGGLKGGFTNEIWNTEDGVEWREVKTINVFGPRYTRSVAAFKGRLWVVGGTVKDGKILSDVWNSVDGVHWEKVLGQAPFFTQKSDPRLWNGRDRRCLVFQGKLWIIDGFSGSFWNTSDGKNWTKADLRLPYGRNLFGFGCAVFKDHIWVLGGDGADGHGLDNVWQTR